jgi:Alfin
MWSPFGRSATPTRRTCASTVRPRHSSCAAVAARASDQAAKPALRGQVRSLKVAPSWRAQCPDSLARAPGVTGNSDGTWKVGLPVEEVPPELPEPALGINFARDGMAVRARTPRPPALLTAARRVNPRRHVVGRTTPRAICAYRVAAGRARKARQGTENGCTACGRSCGSARLSGAWHTSPGCPAARPPGGWLARPGCPVVVSLLFVPADSRLAAAGQGGQGQREADPRGVLQVAGAGGGALRRLAHVRRLLLRCKGGEA